MVEGPLESSRIESTGFPLGVSSASAERLAPLAPAARAPANTPPIEGSPRDEKHFQIIFCRTRPSLYTPFIRGVYKTSVFGLRAINGLINRAQSKRGNYISPLESNGFPLIAMKTKVVLDSSRLM